jgi:NitT/TauT family transport system substrate-binding protein
MFNFRRAAAYGLLGVLGMAASACGGGATAAQNKNNTEMDKVVIQFTWKIRGGYGGIATAVEEGYFAAEGIEVEFQEGTGSQTVMSSLGSAKNVFVFGPQTAAAQAVSQGVPLISVATYQREAPMGLISKPDVPLDSPKDLEGKRLATVTGDTFFRILPLFAERNDVDLAKVKKINMEAAVRTTEFLNGNVDVISVYLDNEYPLLEAEVDGQLNKLTVADWGFPVLGDGIAVSTAFAESDPDLIERFLRAVHRGYADAVQDPDLAVSAMMKRWSEVLPPRDIAAEQIKRTLEYDGRAKVEGQPYGHIPSETWDATLDLLDSAGGIDKRLPTDAYFTNQFVTEE